MIIRCFFVIGANGCFALFQQAEKAFWQIAGSYIKVFIVAWIFKHGLES